HHQEDRAGAGQDGADQAQIHPAPREKEGGLTVKLFKGHYTRSRRTPSLTLPLVGGGKGRGLRVAFPAWVLNRMKQYTNG
ncbi:MAG: hypothetical protein ACREYE_16820, partial [Gammaproteobacteria bacterium]